ncbi:hypothetical protein B0H34DRAFT_763490 [Crassisporium funariophilum]|nr:hypothetical protein B0H34DRAFT_763490 [Crassisporium funariophilum]
MPPRLPSFLDNQDSVILQRVSGGFSIEDQVFTFNCIQFASFIILYYDYFLTLPDERDRFWASPKKLSVASGLFYLNRYLSFLGHVPVMLEYFWTSSDPDRLDRCTRIISYHQYLVMAIQFVVGCLLILRTHALYGRSRRVLALLCVAIMTVCVFGLWIVLGGSISDDYTKADLPSQGCLLPTSVGISLRQAKGWTALLCFDILIFTLTFYKAVTAGPGGISVVLGIMLRDGTIYFGIMVLASISVILSFHFLPPYLRGMTATLTNVLSSTMVSRLMINLRGLKVNSRYDTGPNAVPGVSRLVFKGIEMSAGTTLSQETRTSSEFPDVMDIGHESRHTDHTRTTSAN